MVPDVPPAVDPTAEPAMTEKAPESDPNFPVVAVGASAGGLEAFTGLLQGLPADTGMAFVFIQHLAPSHESMLAQLLSRQTAMPVNEVKDGTILSPNQVYVIPPNAAMTLSGLSLVLTPRESAGTAIDKFLRSLASTRKSRAVAVILSGTGSDGALGVQAIAEEGGVVLAEDPASAAFDGMPRSAIATGCVDFVLPLEGIAAELARIAREPRLIDREPPELSSRFPGSDGDFQAVIDLLHAGTGIDFSLYRQTTFRRRVLRRSALLRKGSLGEYVAYLRENPDELHALSQEILIRVTHFFRDPEAFDVLSKRVFPALIRKTPADGVARVWVPGCSTGEEAYSIAIGFLEVAEQMQSHVPLQVFATDINEAAIGRARRGVYLENIAADVSPERLARFFVRTGREFQVGRRLRDLCVFSKHDLLNDPPFSRMGLISCRNVLIYLDSMQESALSGFHFALSPGGFLLLGKSETAVSAPGLFTTLDKHAKLYVKQESARRAPARRKREPVFQALRQATAQGGRAPLMSDPLRYADRLVIERYGPPRAIVDANLAVVAPGSGNGGFGLEMRSEEALESVKKAQPAALEKAIRTAGRTGQSIRIERVDLGEHKGELDVEITPLGPEGQHFLVAFEERPRAAEAEPANGEPRREDGNLEARVRRLEKDLASSRAHLQSVIVEQEAAHEEVVAGNEELQSLNEELESSKEEIEAANEELTTVNQELQVRNTELNNVSEFAQATIDTVRGSLVVLGPDLRVMKANQSFYRAFRLSPQDVEHRFIYELDNGCWSIPRLRVLLEEVLPHRHNMTDFEMEQALPSGGKRILILNARRFEQGERILLAIEDVTESRHAEEEARKSQKMEAIGYLAAGLAHDFNNLLTGVLGNASLVLDTLPEGRPERVALETVIGGAQHCAELTRQLLAYAGKGRFYLERVNLSDVVVQTGRLIHPSAPSSVQIRLDLAKDPPLLLADSSQMQQVVMNLMINGVEAIGEAGGILQVRTGRRAITGEPLPDAILSDNPAPGEYVFLEVVDNGSGMDEQTMRRIFDPFFSTKFVGRGLGLAAVLGIVRQHRGIVQLHSVLGRGTSFTVLFPVGEAALLPATEDVRQEDLRGSGTVLVVDDEDLIRNFSKSALQRYGYTVLVAADGYEAVRLVRERVGEIALVLLDVAMPGMDGFETLEGIRKVRPGIPIMVSSGFGDSDVEARFAGRHIAGFFQKPYTAQQLARKVKECLTFAATG
jgi:two-component system CheB/CheR fusion protein